MKTRYSLRGIFSIVFCLAITLGCSERDDIKLNDQANGVDVDLLLSQVEKSVNGAELDEVERAKFLKDYKSLNNAQFERFVERFSALTRCETSDMLAEELGYTSALEFRKALNNTAITLYGKTYNQLEGDDLDNVFEIVENPSRGDESNRLAACTGYYYGGNFPYALIGIGIAAVRNVTWIPQTDCDKEIDVPSYAWGVSHSGAPCSAVLAGSNRPYRTASNGTRRILIGNGRYVAGGCWLGTFGWAIN